ncbi:DUF2637 domain-containing protein [Streptomyces griseoaurantiacus]|uniref:DUF2637 domain-containing protein n=1 Tax=Streptomyces griseoaurantiacus TaxID=68213 RepID=UPI00368DA845
MTSTQTTRPDDPKPTNWRNKAASADWDQLTTDGLIYLLALIGFYLGYHTLHTLALAVGYTGNEAQAAAITADIAVLAYSRKAVAEIKAGRSAWGIRLIVAAFSLATFGLQLRAAWPHPTAVGFHAMSPAVWVIGHEMMLRGRLRDAKAARRAAQIAAGLRPAPLPAIRLTWWLLAPFSTFTIWRLVKLTEQAPADVIRMEAARRQGKKKDIPRAWNSYLTAEAPAETAPAPQPVPHTICGPSLITADSLISRPKPLPQITTTVYRQSRREEVPADELNTFLSLLPTAPPKGRPSDKAVQYINDVEALAASYDIKVTGKLLAELLDVTETYVSHLRNPKPAPQPARP